MDQQEALAAVARADLFRFLAACYYEPSTDFVEERLLESLADAASQVDSKIAEAAMHLGEHFAAEPLESLLVDYLRLFLGSPKALAQPYESVWLSGENTVMQESTVRLVELYEEAGFQMDDSFHDSPDHIAVELEFLYLLSYREAQARHGNEHDKIAAIGSMRGRFLEGHLAQWIDDFADAIEVSAGTAFYRALGSLTRDYVVMMRA